MFFADSGADTKRKRQTWPKLHTGSLATPFLQRTSRVPNPKRVDSIRGQVACQNGPLAYHLQIMLLARLPGMECGRGVVGNRIRYRDLVF
jgi:hypothetical protein